VFVSVCVCVCTRARVCMGRALMVQVHLQTGCLQTWPDVYVRPSGASVI
jgi:hypothetical protein